MDESKKTTRQNAWNKRNPDKLAEYKRRYRASDKGKEQRRREWEKRKNIVSGY